MVDVDDPHHDRREPGERTSEVELVLDDSGTIVSVNDRACALYGYTREELIGQPIRVLRATTAQSNVEAQFAVALSGGIQFETLHSKKDRSVVPVSVESWAFTIGGKRYVHSLVRDLRVERARARRGFIFSHLVTQMEEVVIVTEPDFRVTNWTGRAEAVLGRTRAQMLGQNALAAFEQRFEPGDRERVDASLAKGQSTPGHLALKRDDGRWVDLDISCVPLRDGSSELTGWLMVARDVTATLERQRMAVAAMEQVQNALAEATHAAQTASQLKSQFLANMSHELRTPLNAVLGLARLGLDEPSPARLREYMGLIHRSGTNLVELINDILDLSKIEAGKLVVEEVPFRLRALLQDLHDTFEPSADARGLHLGLRVGADVPDLVMGDSLRVRQVVSNLLSNAVKFTAAGRVDLEVVVQQGALSVSVRDTGLGMSEEQLRNLFEAFNQADASTTRKYGGTGLGLAISRQLARLLGGELTVTSKVAVGSLFTFHWPLRLPDEATVQAVLTREKTSKARAVPEALSGHRVLLVEDNRVNLMLARALLQKANLVVTTAENGRQALQLLIAPDAAFDVVLMDVQMPEMDGLQATREARERLGDRCPPIVAMTANALREDRERTRAAGMCAHLTKPIDVDALYATLLDVLASHVR